MATLDAPRTLDDERVAVWPDGWYADLSEIHRGDYAHRSDYFAIVSLTDHAALLALGLGELIGAST